jgi:hypothetical protein
MMMMMIIIIIITIVIRNLILIDVNLSVNKFQYYIQNMFTAVVLLVHITW